MSFSPASERATSTTTSPPCCTRRVLRHTATDGRYTSPNMWCSCSSIARTTTSLYAWCMAPVPISARSAPVRRRSTCTATPVRSACAEDAAANAARRWRAFATLTSTDRARRTREGWLRWSGISSTSKRREGPPCFEGSDGYAAGEQRRDFVSVEDVVRVDLEFLDRPDRSGIYNLDHRGDLQRGGHGDDQRLPRGQWTAVARLRRVASRRGGRVRRVSAGAPRQVPELHAADISRLRAADFTAPMLRWRKACRAACVRL